VLNTAAALPSTTPVVREQAPSQIPAALLAAAGKWAHLYKPA